MFKKLNQSSYSLLLCITRLIQIEIEADRLSTLFISGEYEIDYPSLKVNNISYLHGLKYNFIMDQMFSFRVFLINQNEMSPDVATYMQELFYTRCLNRTAKYIFISENISKDLLRAIELYGLTHVIFLNPYSEVILRYAPNEKTYLQRVGKFSDNLKKLSTSNYLLKYTYSSYWKNLKITLCHRLNCKSCIYGPEFELFEIIFNFLNIKRNYSTIPLHDLSVCDVFYGRIISSYYQSTYQYTVSYFDDRAWWFVPLADPKNNGWFFCKVFSVMLWNLVLWSTLLISLLWFIILTSSSGKCAFMYALQKVLNIIKLTLEQSIDFNTAKTSLAILSTLVIFFTFIVNTVYKIKLLQVLIGKEYDNSISSVFDMINRGMVLGYPSSDFSARAMGEMKAKLRACVNAFDCLRRAALHQEFGVMVHGSDEKRFRRYLVNGNGKYLLRKLSPSFSTSKFVAMLPKGHKFFHVFNRYLTYLIEHGFVQHVNTDVDINYELELGNEVLKMDHFRILFKAWLIILLISIFVFIKEYSQIKLSKIWKMVFHRRHNTMHIKERS